MSTSLHDLLHGAGRLPPSAGPRTRGRSASFGRLGAIVVRRPRRVLVLALVGFLVSAALAVGALGSLGSGGQDDPASDSSQAQALLEQDFGAQPNMIFLLHARQGNVDSPAVVASGSRLATRLEREPGIATVTSYWHDRVPALRSSNGSDALILVTVAPGPDQAPRAGRLLATYAHVDDAATTVAIGGPLGTDIAGRVGADIAVAEAIAVPLTLVLLLVAFGTLVGAVLPLAISALGVAGTFAVLFVLTRFTDVSVFAINITTALGLGLGVDYALLMVSRYREELATGSAVRQAVVTTVATAGRTIAFSALAVISALSALLVFPAYFLRSFAYAGIAVTLVCALAALVVLPALLVVLGTRVNAARLPILPASRSEAPLWGRIARYVQRHPALTTLPVLAALLLAASPLTGTTFGTPDDRVLPAANPAHQVGDALRTGFGTDVAATIDVIATPTPSTPALTAYTHALRALPGVVDVTDRSTAAAPGAGPHEPSDPRVGGSTHLALTSGLDPRSQTAQALVRRIRALPAPPGSRVLVGGATAVLIDAKAAIGDRLPLAAGIVAASMLLLLFLFTGSVVQPVRALLGNLLTLSATLGVVVWIFQDGHLSGLLHATPTPTDTAMPVLVFCIAFGLSMDYEVFLMSRITELHDAGTGTADAVAVGLARTGRIVSTAAALIAVSFFSFASSGVTFIQLFGIASGLAILLDATLVRGVLVPASFRLLGERSWYAPPVLRRLHRRLGISDV